jgi:OmpA-OmpF porin, OOP family
MRLASCALAFAAAFAAAGVHAQPTRSAEDIVEFFSKPTYLGEPRGICIGTEEECRAKAPPPPRPGLDLYINFELDSAELTQDARTKLAEFAEALKDGRLASRSFVVEGFTDATGTAAYNLTLSERRAQSVTDFLVANGVEPSRIRAVGKGQSEPRVPDPYDPINRRVEMRINVE